MPPRLLLWGAYFGGEQGPLQFEAALSRTVSALEAIGVRVVMMAPGPDLPYPAPACLLRRSLDYRGVSRNRAEERRRTVKVLLDRAGLRENVRVVDPFVALCEPEVCPPQVGTIVLFSDSHHFSVAGSRALLPAARAALNWAVYE